MVAFPLPTLEKQNDLTIAKSWVELKELIEKGIPEQL